MINLFFSAFIFRLKNFEGWGRMWRGQNLWKAVMGFWETILDPLSHLVTESSELHFSSHREQEGALHPGMCGLSKAVGTWLCRPVGPVTLGVILIIQQYAFYFDNIYDTFSSPVNLQARWVLKNFMQCWKNLQSLYFLTTLAFHSKFCFNTGFPKDRELGLCKHPFCTFLCWTPGGECEPQGWPSLSDADLMVVFLG